MRRAFKWAIGPAVAVVVLGALGCWYFGRTGPTESARQQKEARPDGPAGRHSPVSFVILPPQVPPGSEGRAEAAGLFCDLLAENLSRGPRVSVVDRSRLDRILAERAAGPAANSPLLSYDAMVRVAVTGAAR